MVQAFSLSHIIIIIIRSYIISAMKLTPVQIHLFCAFSYNFLVMSGRLCGSYCNYTGYLQDYLQFLQAKPKNNNGFSDPFPKLNLIQLLHNHILEPKSWQNLDDQTTQYIIPLQSIDFLVYGRAQAKVSVTSCLVFIF